MLDELLGRAELKEDLAGAEAELERVERRLEAEQERRRDAVRDRQEAEELANSLEDRIAGLEGELERLKEDDSGPSFQRVEEFGLSRTSELLGRLRSYQTEEEAALTAGISDEIPSSVTEVLGDRAALATRAAPCVVCADDLGIVRVALSPARDPGTFETWDDSFTLENEWFLPPERHTFALLRADRFAMGEFEGEERVDFRGFETEVMGKHSKGGFSQSRFERRRDEQIETHLDRCHEALADRSPVPLIVVGDRRMLSKLEVEATATATVDASGDPETALANAFRDYWRTRLYLL